MKHITRIVLHLLVAAILAIVVNGCETETTTDSPDPEDALRSTVPTPTSSSADGSALNPALAGLTEARVVRVVDGDTIIVELNGETERVRYIGVDTPETVHPNSPVECYGEEASEANAELVAGETVYLEKDVSERDRYDRLLRYIYVVQNNEPVFVNLWLVEQGYAQVSTFPPDVKYEDDYLDAQREAREEERGLWGSCPVS